MKKSIKQIIALILSLIMVLSCTVTAFAETIYYYYGYLYTYVRSNMVSLYGLDENSSELIIPSTLNDLPLVDIRNSAFINHLEIESINFSNAVNLQRIGSFAFKGCHNLIGDLVIPPNVNTIETAAFQDSGISAIVLDINGTTIPNQCCYMCTNLSSVALGDSIKFIGDYAFAQCKSLEYIEIPTSVQMISSVAFDKDIITLGVYTNSYAHQYAEDNGIKYVLLDAPEPPTEPEPTEIPTELIPTEKPTIPSTEVPTEVPTELSTETEILILGDVDKDGLVTTVDATLVQRYLSRISTFIDYDIMMLADVDNDGIISIIDVSFMMRYIVGVNVSYPIGDPITTI